MKKWWLWCDGIYKHESLGNFATGIRSEGRILDFVVLDVVGVVVVEEVVDVDVDVDVDVVVELVVAATAQELYN